MENRIFNIFYNEVQLSSFDFQVYDTGDEVCIPKLTKEQFEKSLIKDYSYEEYEKVYSNFFEKKAIITYANDTANVHYKIKYEDIDEEFDVQQYEIFYYDYEERYKPNPYEFFKNKLIIFEGIDNTGKTTCAKKLSDFLNKNNIETVYTFQPGDTNYGVHGNLFRSMCKDKRWDLHELTNFFIFFADKVEQAHKIILPALRKGKTVISDRWWYSTYAYQFFGKEIIKKYKLSDDMGKWLNNVCQLGCKPDLVYYFHEQIENNIGERISDTGNNDAFENQKDVFFTRVDNAYNNLYNINKNIFVKVPLMDSPDESLNKVINLGLKFFNKGK